ncbi:hypothetical protein QZH41_011622 [Actinostola sp. cb2023]|nr:hypothetical protein QZH41_011622 [Actinostola sp. cb2023]
MLPSNHYPVCLDHRAVPLGRAFETRTGDWNPNTQSKWC